MISLLATTPTVKGPHIDYMGLAPLFAVLGGAAVVLMVGLIKGDFVQRVLANYWMYQIRLGQPTPSLDQIAAHEWPRYTAQDSGR